VSNAYPRSAGGSGWDDHDRPSPDDWRPRPSLSDGPPRHAEHRPPFAEHLPPYADGPPPFDEGPWSLPEDLPSYAEGPPPASPDRAAPSDGHDARAVHQDAYDAGAVDDGADEVETPVPVGQRVRGLVEAATTAGRSSVPLRTVLFLVPPLLVPPLAFDLSLGATVGVWLLLLWLVGATAVVTTLMADGTDMVAMQAIGRHLERIAATSTRPADEESPADVARPPDQPADHEALLVVGEQLDALNDRLDALEAGGGASHAGPIDHRPPEQWSPPWGVVDNGGDDHDVADGRHWSPPRWQR
jgi:hypothetical protein